MRFGSGLIWKLKDEKIFLLPLRGPNAPSKPLHIDSSSGRPKENEHPIETQTREGTEETVLVKNNNLVLPDIIKNKSEESNILSNYQRLCKKYNYLPEIDGVEYIDSKIETPKIFSKYKDSIGSTGYTIEHENVQSIEFLNDLVLNINEQELVNKYEIYDIEASYNSEKFVHYDRPTVILKLGKGLVKVLHQNQVIFHGNINQLLKFLEKYYEQNLQKPITTIKVQHRLRNVAFYGKNILVDFRKIKEAEDTMKKINVKQEVSF